MCVFVIIYFAIFIDKLNVDGLLTDFYVSGNLSRYIQVNVNSKVVDNLSLSCIIEHIKTITHKEKQDGKL